MLSIIFYAIIGGTIFAILGAIAAYSREDRPTAQTLGRDWIAGILITIGLNFISSSLMPPIDWIENISLPNTSGISAIKDGFTGGSVQTASSSIHRMTNDYPLHIGIQPKRY